MLHSKGKEYDLKFRAQLLDLTEICLTKGKVEDAKYFGNYSKLLKERIQNHDYKEEDELYKTAEEIDRRFSTLTYHHI